MAYMAGSDSERALEFQAEGASHDSVEDATWTLRVAVMEAERLAKGLGRSPPLKSLPARYLQQLHLRNLPKESTADTVRALFGGAGAALSEGVEIRDLRPNDAGSCSTVVSFPDVATAHAAFQAFCTVAKPWADEEASGEGGTPLMAYSLSLGLYRYRSPVCTSVPVSVFICGSVSVFICVSAPSVSGSINPPDCRL